MAKVLIVMATKNRAHLLPKALNSIRNQTYPHWRLIVIEDGSADDTDNILDYYCKLDYRISMMDNFGGRHFGLIKQSIMVNSTEEFLAQLDDDDYWSPAYLEEMVNALEKNPQASEVYCDYILIKELGVPRYYHSNRNLPFPDTLPSISVFRGDLFRGMGGWDLKTFNFGSTYIHAEADFYIRAMLENGVVHIPKALGSILRSTTSMSASRELNVWGLEALIKKWDHLLSKDKKLWAQYYARLGLSKIEANLKGQEDLLTAIKTNPLFLEAWGALILSSLNRSLFLKCYNVYRRTTGR